MGSLSRGTKEEAFSILPAGTVLPFAGATAPSGWALCDGSVVSRTEYAELYMAVGDAWGNGDGSTTFHLPDMRGRFMRGTDNGAGRDVDSGSRTAANAGGNAGDNVGAIQSDAIRNLTGNFAFTDDSVNGGGVATKLVSGVFGTNRNAGYTYSLASTSTDTDNNNVFMDASRQVPTASDNRPVNANMNYIIKL